MAAQEWVSRTIERGKHSIQRWQDGWIDKAEALLFCYIVAHLRATNIIGSTPLLMLYNVFFLSFLVHPLDCNTSSSSSRRITKGQKVRVFYYLLPFRCIVWVMVFTDNIKQLVHRWVGFLGSRYVVLVDGMVVYSLLLFAFMLLVPPSLSLSLSVS